MCWLFDFVGILNHDVQLLLFSWKHSCHRSLPRPGNVFVCDSSTICRCYCSGKSQIRPKKVHAHCSNPTYPAEGGMLTSGDKMTQQYSVNADPYVGDSLTATVHSFDTHSGVQVFYPFTGHKALV